MTIHRDGLSSPIKVVGFYGMYLAGAFFGGLNSIMMVRKCRDCI